LARSQSCIRGQTIGAEIAHSWVIRGGIMPRFVLVQARAFLSGFLLPLLLLAFRLPAAAATSEDGYVSRNANTWTLGTAKVERTIVLANGRFFTTSFKDKVTGHELLTSGAGTEEIGGLVDGKELSSQSGGWKLVGAVDRVLAGGEIHLDITLRRGFLQVIKTYVVYPGTSIIREWVEFKNVGTRPLRVSQPQFLGFAAKVGSPESERLHWMTGGEDRPGSWTLKSEQLQPGTSRAFDSYDPFDGSAKGNFTGDGVIVRIAQNENQIWPANDWLHKKWEYVPNADSKVPVDAEANVLAGDRVAFIVNRFGTPGSDLTAFDPAIVYSNGEAHTASQEFTGLQGKNSWRYQFREESRISDPDLARFHEALPTTHQSDPSLQLSDLVYDDTASQWRRPGDHGADAVSVGRGEMTPALNYDAVLVWIAPRSGKVRITATVSNIGNTATPGAGRAYWGGGSSAYAPWAAIVDTSNHQGVFMGWDYFGHWASTFLQGQDGSVSVKFRVAGHNQSLKPGESLTTPMAFTGLFDGNLDEAGNEVLDWQYRYLWDYTRDGWFGAIRQAGWWWKGTGWPDLRNTRWIGHGPLTLTLLDADSASTYRKIFRLADFISETGADVYHRDCCWWDRTGDWGGPDFKASGIYLRKYSIGQLLYSPIYMADSNSALGRSHPDWIVKSTLDLSKPAVVEYLSDALDKFHQRFGKFEWRTDGIPTAYAGDDTPLLGQDQGFRQLLRNFLDRHPEDAFQACNGGGNEVGYDYARYASSISFSDGGVGILSNYWASLFLPPDKTGANGDFYEADKFEPATYRGLLTMAFDNAGDTWDAQKLEGMRQLIEIYHFLSSEGVAGRWAHVYRPWLSGDDPIIYFERLSRDGKRGIIIPKRPAPGPVTIRPKGLMGDESYLVSYQESSASETRTGSDLMENGIRLESMLPGELVYLNLPYHPGNHRDTPPPSPPSGVKKAGASNMGYPGVEITWQPGHDDHWISYYEVLRDSALAGIVAKGNYYFDHSAGADPAAIYAVRTIDGAGLRSELVAAEGPGGDRATVIDDAASSGITFQGSWQREANLQPAYLGTISRSNEKGASFTLEFEGSRLTWFTKLGEDGGKAAVSIDGQPDVIVDTYSADDIWGVGILSKTFSAPGKHKVRVSVLGQPPDAFGTGTFVYVDGMKIDR
jgi:hypothetical protein